MRVSNLRHDQTARKDWAGWSALWRSTEKLIISGRYKFQTDARKVLSPRSYCTESILVGSYNTWKIKKLEEK